MIYDIRFPSAAIERRFEKELLKIKHQSIQDAIIAAVESLASEPRPYGGSHFKKIKPPVIITQFLAQYRIRFGDYRVLYDIDVDKYIVWLLALRRRSEKTYK